MTPLILLVATLGLATGLLIAAFWLVKKRFGYASYASGIATVVLGLPLVIAATALALLTDTSTIFGPSIARPDLKVVELGFFARPMDVAGDRSVGIGPGGEVYLGNVRTGDVRQLTDDGHRKMQPVIYGDIVAWTDQSRGIETHDNNSFTHRGLADDIYVLDLNTGEKRRITEVPAKRRGLRISGNRLVWQDNRNEFGEHQSHFDIYAYDLETDEEIAVAVAPGPQSLGAIDGDRIVWSDDRNSGNLGADRASCFVCPDNRSGIYLFDFTAGEELLVDEPSTNYTSPDIHDHWVVWRGRDDKGRSTIRLYDLDTGETRTLASPRLGRVGGPLVSGNYVVWTVGWDCDVEPWPTDLQYGAFAYDLRTGEVIQLSDYIEPSIAIDGDVAVINEGCLGFGSTYAVFLPE